MSATPSCKNCKHRESCGALSPHRFTGKRDRTKFINSSSKDCKDWGREDVGSADAKQGRV